jgi:hypothetical protein
VTISSTSDTLTGDSDINDHKTVSMYYCVVLLFPWLLYEICVLSLTILPSSFLSVSSQCVHNLPQTWIPLGKLISNSIRKTFYLLWMNE